MIDLLQLFYTILSHDKKHLLNQKFAEDRNTGECLIVLQKLYKLPCTEITVYLNKAYISCIYFFLSSDCEINDDTRKQ